ncbi:MAG: J domain-containing protein [Chloroflexota bacterium]
MEYRDYYGTLGVPRDATQADLKRAFRKLARKHHPDVNKGDTAAEQRFKEVNEAYDVLSDPEKRKLYDQLGSNWDAYQRGGGQGGDPFAGFRGASGQGGVRFEYHGDAEDLSGFSDFFRAFFAGGAGGGTRSARGSRTSIDLDDLLHEAARTDTERRPRKPRSSGPKAPHVDPSRGDPFAGLRIEYADDAASRGPLPSLEANAEVTLREVATGTDRVVQIGERRLEVRIPAGVADGQRIRLPRTATEHTGDATLIVRVRPDGVFTRDGADLTREVSLTLRQALLGAEVPIETVTGKRLLLRVPEGTQPGRTFRLTGQGLPRFRGEGNGDLFVRARLSLPARLDDRGRQLASAFLDHIDPPPTSGTDGASSGAATTAAP